MFISDIPMKSIIKVNFLLLALLLVVQCGKRQPDDWVECTFSSQPGNMAEISVKRMSMLNLEQISLGSGKFDSVGRCILRFKIPKSTFATLRIGEREFPLYLQPGYKVRAYVSDNVDTIRFSGLGADPNNYLFVALLAQREIEQESGISLYSLKPEDVLPRLRIIERVQSTLLEKFKDSLKLVPEVASRLKNRDVRKIIQIKQALGFNYGAQFNTDVPEILNVTQEIPYDTGFLDIGMVEYALIHHINMVIKERRMERDSIDGQLRPIVINNELQKANYSAPIMEFLLAKNLDFWMSSVGLAPSIDTLYFQYKNEFPTSRYISDLQKKYQGLLAIEPGQLAPEIKGLSPQGDTLLLSSLRGKIVYVDVWASWCGPCIQEIPSSKVLQSKFKDKGVAFLNVSVDSDTTSWKKAMEEYAVWGGTHLINDCSIYKIYNLRGIPRYILIDKFGKVVNNAAPPPSSVDLEKKILELL